MSQETLRKLLSSSSARPPRGYRVVVLVGEEKNAMANKIALRMARAFINRDVDHIVMLHCAQDDFSSLGAEVTVLKPLADPAFEDVTSFQVLIKDAEMSVAETLAEYIDATMPDLVVVGSHGLCAEDAHQAPPSRSGPLARATSNIMSKMGGGTVGKSPRTAFALRVVQVVRKVPLLVVKANTQGLFLAPGSHGIRCMVDTQANSRHTLSWLMQRLSPDKDTLYLAATKASEADGSKLLAERTLTAFHVQCQVNSFSAEKRIYKEPPQRALPMAVQEEQVDMLVIQTPRSRDIGPLVADLLCEAKTSILLWPADYDGGESMRSASSHASGRASATGTGNWEVAAARAISAVDEDMERASAPAALNGTGSMSRLRRASGAVTAYEAAMRSQEYLQSASGSKRAPAPKPPNGLHPGAALSASESVLSTRRSVGGTRPLSSRGE